MDKTKISKKPFDGARKFRYIKNNREHFVYSDEDLREKPDVGPRLQFLLILLIPLILIFFILPKAAVKMPVPPLSERSINSTAVYDEADLFDDDEEAKLLWALNEFTNSTGVVVNFVTVNWDECEKSHSTLSSYADYKYDELFDDENGWLIVHSETYGGEGYPDTSLRGMFADSRGSNTYDILRLFIDEFNYNVDFKFKSHVYKILGTSYTSACDVFIWAINDIAIESFNNQQITISLFMGLFIILISFMLAYFAFDLTFRKTNISYKNKDLEEVDI